MGALDGLEPRPVFRFFEELTRIPHGSGNIDKISDYLADFAGSRGFFVEQDEAKNIVITMPATAGREKLEPLILQGHMDMVAVKDEGCDIDMTHDPLRLKTDGETVWAEGTSLGADDGIAVAYFCALMDDPDIPHPELILIITTDEETGMDGARALAPELLKGKRFINIDSEDEGVLLAGCAGGARVHISLPVRMERRAGLFFSVEVKGLLGGHSGQEIIKERGNANLIIGRLLQALIDADCVFGVCGMSGGVADNAIPSSAELTLVLPEGDDKNRKRTEAVLNETLGYLKTELGAKDPDIELVTDGGVKPVEPYCFTEESARAAAALLMTLPNGIQAMSADMPGLVETSLNLGVMSFDPGETKIGGSGTPTLHLDFAVRSSLESARELLIRRLELTADNFGAESETHGRYPGWAYDPNSVICAHFARVWEKINGSAPRVEAIHAGVECGLFKEKSPELDCISFGPDLEHVHSTKERLHVASAARTWDYLKAVLEAWDKIQQ